MDNKRLFREEKRAKKKDGNRSRRNYLKRALRDNPGEAHWDEFQFKGNSTKDMNGCYPDGTKFIKE